MITLTAGPSKASILPEMGAGLAGLWVDDLPVLRPWPGQVADGPFALACNLLVPFSNRISGGGFTSEGQFHQVAANLEGEAFPIHGDGFQRPWQVAKASASDVEMTLAEGRIGPFRHAAQVTYRLSASGLTTKLRVTNRGETALPFGLGLHPWFPRDAQTRLQFTATGAWPETAQHLPAHSRPDPHPALWNTAAALPDGWINMGFSGWDGTALILQGPRAVTVRIGARGLSTAILYSPSVQADFFCFEPVSHPVDAHNLPGQPGLVRLAPGETLSAAMTLTWDKAA